MGLRSLKMGRRGLNSLSKAYSGQHGAVRQGARTRVDRLERQGRLARLSPFLGGRSLKLHRLADGEKVEGGRRWNSTPFKLGVVAKLSGHEAELFDLPQPPQVARFGLCCGYRPSHDLRVLCRPAADQNYAGLIGYFREDRVKQRANLPDDNEIATHSHLQDAVAHLTPPMPMSHRC